MLNNKPNGATKTYHGLYVPNNPGKTLQLNNEGGFYYRSMLERKTMTYLDNNPDVVKWNAEYIQIPYQLVKYRDNDEPVISEHRYTPDFYYELKMDDGSIRSILLEVKPLDQINPPVLKEGKRLTSKQIEDYNKRINEYERNMCKWKYAIAFCKTRGYEFKLLHEKVIDQMVFNMSRYYD